jgi:hypothetical protein
MHKLRCIIAALFAILIASPVCCCAAMVKVDQAVEHSCCGHSKPKKEKHQDECDCTTKTPRIAESHPAAPQAPVFIAPESLPAVAFSPSLELPANLFSSVPASIDTGPPKLRLAMLQRFLI